MNLKKIMRWIPAIFIMGLIFVFSNIPHLQPIDPLLYPPWLQKLINICTFRIGGNDFFSYVITIDPNFIIHKMGHITFYGLLGVSFYYATEGSVVRAIILTCLYAISDELHQGFVAGRSARLGDIALDTLSATIFVLAVKSKGLLQNFRNNKSNSRS